MAMMGKDAFIVYSDLKGFSDLEADEQERYIIVHIHLLGKTIQPFLERALVSNTWGDAIIAAFEDGEDAAEFMLKYRDEAKVILRGVSGKNLLPRIAGHYGKVNVFSDPLLDRANILSKEVNTVARIEPVTRPGEIFVSKEFKDSFVLQSEQQVKVKFERLGVIPLAKNHGEKELFRLIYSNEGAHIIDSIFDMDFPPALPAEPEFIGNEKSIIEELEKMTKREHIQRILEKEWNENHSSVFSKKAVKVCKKAGLYADGIKWIEKVQKEQIETGGITLFPFKTEKEVVKLKADLLTRLDRYDESAELLYGLWRNIDGRENKDSSDILSMLAAQFKRRALTKDNELLSLDSVDEDHLKSAAGLYLEAFRYNIEDFYPAINAAYLLILLRGKYAQQGKRLARYITSVWGNYEKGVSYWMDFTLAEAELLLGFYDDAFNQLEIAFKTYGEKIGVFEIESTRLQIIQFFTLMGCGDEGEEIIALLNSQLQSRLEVYS